MQRLGERNPLAASREEKKALVAGLGWMEEEKREKKRGEKAGGEEPFSSHPSLAMALSVASLSFLAHSPQAAGVKLVTTPLGALPSQGYAANS